MVESKGGGGGGGVGGGGGGGGGGDSGKPKTRAEQAAEALQHATQEAESRESFLQNVRLAGQGAPFMPYFGSPEQVALFEHGDAIRRRNEIRNAIHRDTWRPGM